MRYIIIGAGAVGGTVGGRLFESGHDVVLVARGRHYEALSAKGLRLRDPEREAVLPIPAADGPERVELRADDVLVLAVKTQDTAAVLDAWADRPVRGGRADAGPDGAGRAADLLPIVCAQNGVENERLALRRFRRVYGACVWMPATHLDPGVVEAQGSPLSGILHLGRYPSGADDTVHRIAEDLVKAKFLAPVRDDVMRWKYGKLLANLANAVNALSGAGAGSELAELTALAVTEAEAVLDAAGINVASRDEQAGYQSQVRTRPVVGGSPWGGGSSWQSLVRATGSIETDYLNGEIALLGRLHGVPTPVNALLQRLADRFARERRSAGSLPAAELLRLVREATAAESTAAGSTAASTAAESTA